MTSYSNNDKTKIIMEHYSNPETKTDLSNEKTIDVYSTTCVDELHLKIEIENDEIKNANFDGKGCAVFLASSDIFLTKIINKNIKFVNNLIDNYSKMIEGKEFDETELGKLLIFKNVKVHLNRLQCAKMIVKGLSKVFSS